MSAWRYLASLSWTFKWTFALDFIGIVVVIVGLEQVFALTLREIFDTLTGDARTSLSVWTLCGVIVGIATARFGVRVGTITLQFANEFMIGALLRRNVLAYVMDLSGDRSLPASPGEAVTRFRDDASSVGEFLIGPKFIAANLVFAAIAVIIMMRISPFITLVGFVPFMVVLTVVHIAKSRIERTRRQSREAAGNVTGFLGEMFGSAEAIKVAGAEDRILDEFDYANTARKRTTLRDTLLTETLNAIFQNVDSIGTGAILIVAGQAMLSGQFTVGDLALFVFYLEAFSWLWVGLGLTMTQYRQVGVGIGRLHELMPGAPPEKLVERNPTHLFRKAPEPVFPVEKTEADRLESLEASGVTYVYPDSERGVRTSTSRCKRGRSPSSREESAPARARCCACCWVHYPCRRARLLWNDRAGRGRERGLGAAARRLHVPGTAPVQRGAARQYPAGPP